MDGPLIPPPAPSGPAGQLPARIRRRTTGVGTPPDGEPRPAGVADELLDTVDAEVRRISAECYEEARRLLRDNRDRPEAIVALLLERETLDEAEVYAAAGIARNTAEPARV